MNRYTETQERRLVDLTKIARIDVVRVDVIRVVDAMPCHRWNVVITMADGDKIVYLYGGLCQSETNPCYTEADREISEDERDTMNQVAMELMMDVSNACAEEEIK